MRKLFLDGESGTAKSDKRQQYFARMGIRPNTRGKDQRAIYVERRSELLRQVAHRIYSQLQQEELKGMLFFSVLAEATFAGNALLSIHGSSPYNAVYGRAPADFPGIDQSPDSTGLGA